MYQNTQITLHYLVIYRSGKAREKAGKQKKKVEEKMAEATTSARATKIGVQLTC